MLDVMRRNTKVILWITVICFVLLIFLVWGADLQFGSGGAAAAGAAGSINGEPVSWATYQQILAVRRESARAQGRDLRPSDELLIEEQTWNSLVEEMLLVQEAKRRGLAPKDSEVRAVLLNDPPPSVTQAFVNEQGVFDANAYRSFLSDPNTPEAQLVYIENIVRQTLPAMNLQRLITSSAKVAEDEIRRAWVEQTENAKVTWTLVEHLRFPVDGDPTDAELSAHFESNRERYALPKRVDLRYVSVPRVASGEDSLQIQKDLRELADEARRSAAGDETASDFETLAITFSDAPNAEEGGLSAGYLTPSELAPPYQGAIAGLSAGQICEPFRDGGFYHIVQLVDSRAPSEATGGDAHPGPEVQIRDLALRIEPSDSTLTSVRESLDAVRLEALSKGLTKAAETAGFRVETASGITASGIVPGLAAIPQVTAFAHENPTGTMSRLFATNSAWYLLEVASVTEAGTPTLTEVRDRVRSDLQNERRYAAAKATADRVFARTKAGETLDAAAAPESLTVTTSPPFTRRLGIPGLGRDPDVVGVAFSLPVGATSGPIKSERGWVFLRIDERPELDWTLFEPERPRIQETLLSTKQVQIYNAWLDALRKNADIQDNRS